MFGLVSRMVRRCCGKEAFPSKFLANEIGATAVEYSLLVAFIATVIFGSVALLGPALLPGFQTVVSRL